MAKKNNNTTKSNKGENTKFDILNKEIFGNVVQESDENLGYSFWRKHHKN